MSLAERMIKYQTAVYWALGSSQSGGVSYGDDAAPVYVDPVEIECRWEDRCEEFIRPDGTRVASRAVVFVGVDVSIGGVLMLGNLDSGLDSDEPKNNNGAWEIQSVEKIPYRKATKFLRIAYL